MSDGCPRVPLLSNSHNPLIGPALSGVDVVSYFSLPPQNIKTNTSPLMGNENYSSKYKSYTFLFSSLSNKKNLIRPPKVTCLNTVGFAPNQWQRNLLNQTHAGLLQKEILHGRLTVWGRPLVVIVGQL